MSSKAQTFVIWGVLLAYEDVTYEQVENHRMQDVKDGGVGVLYDGCNGEYAYVGIPFARSNEYGVFDEVVQLPLLSHGDGSTMPRFAEWHQAIRECLKATGLEIKALGLQIGWHVVTHWS
jgi:hypothetical protein